MKGTDVTAVQLAAAEDFLLQLNRRSPECCSGRVLQVRFDDLVRIVAWYGAIRAGSVIEGGTVDQPGSVTVRPTGFEAPAR